MGQVIISSAPTELNSGLLQLQGGVAMSSTLTTVTDQNNNASPLKLSTTQVQTLSTLKITTVDNPYIDAEDGAGNNRFTVGRDPSSQQVNVDFASNPTGSTTNVGAIRTYVDGVNLSEVMTFREDGYINVKGTLQVGTDGQSGSIVFPTTVSGFATSIFTAYASNRLTIQCGGATNIQFNSWIDLISSASTIRIDGGTHTTTLSTNNTTRFVNTGFSGTNTTYFVNTNVGVNETSPTAKLQIKGSGSTSATTSLLVQNSAGNRLLETKDNGDLYVGNTASNTGTIVVPHSPTYVDRVFMSIDGGFPLFSTISNAILEISCGQFYTKGNMVMRNLNEGIIGQTANATNNSSIQLTTSVNSYGGTSQDDACNLLYVKNNGTILQAQGSVNWIKMDGTVNEAGGGGAKWCTGIYYNPTLTGGTLLANSHYCYHATSGQMMVNTTSPQSSAQLQVDSTTRGFLPPRMTDAQIRAIASPVNGLVAFNTDINVLCCYQAGIWVKFSHSPM